MARALGFRQSDSAVGTPTCANGEIPRALKIRVSKNSSILSPKL